MAAACLFSAGLDAQSGQIQFVIAAHDASGAPVPDLLPSDIVMIEAKARATVLKVEPHPIPVKLTVAVDNGAFSVDMLAHYRTGLSRMLDTLPGDMEVTLITTAPQPRMVVRPTTDRVAIRRGITGFATEEAQPRFTDALVEYSKRLEEELRFGSQEAYIPLLLMVSTTANEAANYQVSEIQRALEFLVARRSRVVVVMMSTRSGSVIGDLNNNRQSLIAIPTTKITGGRYEALSVSNRLLTLLPEIGQEIAALHRKHSNQVLVTVQRPEGVSGPISDPNIYITRKGVTGSVSADGFPPRAGARGSEP